MGGRRYRRGAGARRAAVGLALAACLVGVAIPASPVADAGTNEPAPTLLGQWGLTAYTRAIDADADGNVYVGDGSERILKFAADGTRLAAWGGHGTADGQFLGIDGLTVGPDGSVYVTDRERQLVQRFSSAGTFLSRSPAIAGATDTAVDAEGNYYVVTGLGRRVEKRAPDGTLLTSWAVNSPAYVGAVGIEVDSTGAVYVADVGGYRIAVYSAGGDLLRSFGSAGTGDGLFRSGAGPTAIAIDAADNVFVLDAGNRRVQQFTAAGAYVAQWGAGGAGDGQFEGPTDLAVGADGQVLVVDETLGRVQEFEEFDGAHAFVRGWDVPGEGERQFREPSGIASDAAGNLYVVDSVFNRIQKFDADGDFLQSWGGTGSGPGQLARPTDLDVGMGSVWVADLDNDRIQRFTLDGTFQAAFGSTGNGDGQFRQAWSIDIADGRVYVADALRNRVQIFEPDGAFVRGWTSVAGAHGVAVDRAGIVWVTGGAGIATYEADGTLRSFWPDNSGDEWPTAGNIEVDAAGSVWLVEARTGTLRRLRSDRSEVMAITLPGAGTPGSYRAADITFGPDRKMFVVGRDEPHLTEYQAGTGALVDIGVAIDQEFANVGDPIDHRVTVHNTGTVALTEVALGHPAAPECAGPVPDLAPGDSHLVHCTHTAVAGDVGQYASDATVTSAQGAETSASATLPVGGEPGSAVVDTFSAGGYDIDAGPGGGFSLVRGAGPTVVDRFDATGTLLSSLPVETSSTLLAVGPDGHHYAATTGAVRRYDAAGTVVSTITSAAGLIESVTVGDDGSVYLATRTTQVCVRYVDDNPDRGCMQYETRGRLGVSRIAPNSGRTDIGAEGTGDGQLQQASDVAVHDDQVYVADWSNDRVVTFTPTGSFVRNLPVPRPVSVATAPDGTLYVVSNTGRLTAYLPDGTLRSVWQGAGSGGDQRLAVDAFGRLLLRDPSLAQPVQVYARPAMVGGTVTEAGSGEAVAGAWVAVLRASDFSLAGAAIADGNGQFSAEVPTGTYFLYAIDTTGRHSAGFGTPTPSSPTVVSSGSLSDADISMAPAGGTVSGSVTQDDSGLAVGGASVLVMSLSGLTERVVSANGSGGFSVPDVSAGEHLLAYFDPTGAHRPEFYADAPSVPSAVRVNVTAGGNAVANDSLAPQVPIGTGAALTGTVTADGSGDPLADVEVVALRAADYSMARSGRTNASGAYSLDVAPGAYKLVFIDSSGDHVQEWHADVPYHDLGSAVSVTAPAATNAALGLAAGSIAGTVSDDGSGDGVADAWVVAIGPSGIAGGAVTASDGGYVIEGLAPGSYRVTVVDTVGGRPQEYWQDSSGYDGSSPVAATAGQVTTGISPAIG